MSKLITVDKWFATALQPTSDMRDAFSTLLWNADQYSPQSAEFVRIKTHCQVLLCGNLFWCLRDCQVSKDMKNMRRKCWNTREFQSSTVRCLLNFSFQKRFKVCLLVFLVKTKSLEPRQTMAECQHFSFSVVLSPVPNNSFWQFSLWHKTIVSKLSSAVGE